MNKAIFLVLVIIALAIGPAVEFFIYTNIELSSWFISLVLVNGLFIFWLSRKQAQLNNNLKSLESSLRISQLELAQINAELPLIKERSDSSSENEQVASELRMLRTLMKQFSEKLQDRSKIEGTKPEDSTQAATKKPAAKKVQSVIHEPILNYTDDEILQYLEKAVREDRIELYLQPIVILPQRTRVFFECFSRITDEKGNIIRPEQYLPIANIAGLTAAVDNLLLFRCVQLVKRTRREQPNIAFFCNISKATLTDIEFFTDFIDFMADNTQLTSSLVFEFNQNTLLDTTYEIQSGLQRLSKLGFRLSLDQLNEIEIDLPKLASQGFKFIKIDAHLLHEMARGNSPTLNMKVLKGALDREAMDLIVEKIENEEMLLDLLDLKIDFGQGYLFGAPQPVEVK